LIPEKRTPIFSTFKHLSKVEYQKSFEGFGVVDLEVDEFASMAKRQRKRSIAKRKHNDRKKETLEKVILTMKEKKRSGANCKVGREGA